MSTYIEVPDLLFKGAKVYTLQEDTSSTPVTPPTSIPSAPTQLTYPVHEVTLPDAMFLYKMDYFYRQALKNLPGSHQIFFDILSNQFGKTYWQLTGTAQQNMQVAVNQVINWAGSENAAATQLFDTNKYTGPLKVIYNNLVTAKLAGKV